MEKDYVESKRFSRETFENYDIPYAYRDLCVDDYVIYQKCLRLNPQFLENSIAYRIPLLNRFSKCQKLHETWQKCQKYRENEIFEEMRKIHLEQTRKANRIKVITDTLDRS